MSNRTLCSTLFLLVVVAAAPARAAQTSCRDNGGAGYTINTASTTVIGIPFGFADAGVVTDVDVTVDISHPWVGDLSASIDSPGGGGPVLLFHRPGIAGPPTGAGPPYGCDGNDIDVLFDDESGNGIMENAACGNNPAYGPNDYQPHNLPGGNALSLFDGLSVAGDWPFTFENAEPYDVGTMNEACITVSFAGATFDQFVSTTPACGDQVDNVAVLSGTPVYVCYGISNQGDESLELRPGDWSDSLGNDLSGLVRVYNAGESDSVSFGPFVTPTTMFPIGTTNATSQVTLTGNSLNFPSTETLVIDEAASVTVNNSAPAAGNKPLYLYNNLNMSRTPTPGDQAELTFNEGVSRTWTLTPAMQGALSIDTTGGQIPVDLYMRESGSGSTRDMTLTISGSVSGLIGTTSTSFALTTGSVLYTVNVPITGATSLVAGETLTFFFQNDTTGFGQRAIIIDPSDGAANPSLVNLPSNTVINVDEVSVFDAAYPGGVVITRVEPANTVYVRARISDPFGSFDISSATIDLTDPAPTLQINDAAMTQVIDSGVRTKTFEYSWAVPPFPVQGYWELEVTGNEGNEGVFHMDFIDFPVVAPPQLTIVSSATTADPTDVVTQSIDVTNNGDGEATDIQLSDTLGAFQTLDEFSFVCVCGGTSITLGPLVTTDDGMGTIIQWDMVMGGTLGPGESFTLQYDTQID